MKTIPSILDLAKVPSRARVIGLPDGRQCTIKTFVAAWRKLKTLPPAEEVKGWTWYCMTAGQILAAISRGVEDRINLRAGVRTQWRDNAARWEAERRRRVVCFCKWCGSQLPAYQPDWNRFCEASCRHSFCS